MALAQTVREVVGGRGEVLREGRISRTVEEQTTRIPSGIYLNLAFVSIVTSLGIAGLSRRPAWATFVGLWAPVFMLLGLFKKLSR